jgi:hypothetical protein
MFAVATGTTISWHQFHQHIYARLFRTNDKKLLFAGCHMPKKALKIFCAESSIFSAICRQLCAFQHSLFAKNVDEIDPWCQAFSYQSFLRHFYVLTIWVCNFFGERILVQKLLIKCW